MRQEARTVVIRFTDRASADARANAGKVQFADVFETNLEYGRLP
jgi:hypothetical protein